MQFGGQTPLKLARDLEANGVPIIGTSPDSIDRAEDRERFQQLLHELGLKQPPNRTARAESEALALAEEIGYPLVVRPSYVLGGRAMEIVHDQRDLERYMREAVKVSNDSPVLLDRFLNDAIEVDVDAIGDGTDVLIGGIMEHIEQAGVHSGDSACSLPPFSLCAGAAGRAAPPDRGMARALNVVGLMNVQFAIQDGDGVRAGGQPARLAHRALRVEGHRVAAREDRRALHGRASPRRAGRRRGGRSAVLLGQGGGVPVHQVPGRGHHPGPEMKSTGEVMGVGETFAEAFLKSQLAAGRETAHLWQRSSSACGRRTDRGRSRWVAPCPSWGSPCTPRAARPTRWTQQGSR